jgi:hypothetical protein
VFKSIVPVLLLALATACGQTRAPWDREVADDDEKPEDVTKGPSVLDQELPGGDGVLTNLASIVEDQKLAPYHRGGFHGQGIKVAIFDNGFVGLNRSLGKRLPPDTKLAESPLPDMLQTNHGLKLAEIVYAIATGQTAYDAAVPGPTILLYNTNGFTNLRAAIDQAIADEVDVILYAQVWEYGGNFDGKGFINREVKRATDAGILWINAAGNVGQATYNGPVVYDDKGQVTLPHDGKYVRFTVAQSGTPVKVVLAWNDFDESKDYSTPQDLDLVLEDEQGTTVGEGLLRQTGSVEEKPANYSAHAREIINATLYSGTYFLSVEAKSKNFNPDSRLRLTVGGDHVRMLEKSEDDTILVPADNPAVLTVGATDVDYSGRKTMPDGSMKPEVSVRSEVRFDDGQAHFGTSAASAIAAGVVAVMGSANGALDREAAIRAMRRAQTGRIVLPTD